MHQRQQLHDDFTSTGYRSHLDHRYYTETSIRPSRQVPGALLRLLRDLNISSYDMGHLCSNIRRTLTSVSNVELATWDAKDVTELLQVPLYYVHDMKTIFTDRIRRVINVID